MKISIYGTGYVGLVTGVCLAELGHDVCCMDVNPEKIAQCRRGVPPIYEENLEELLKSNLVQGRIQFTTDLHFAVEHADIQMIAVGTPPQQDGSADLQYVDAVATNIAAQMQSFKLIVTKSTVPVGTADRVRSKVAATLASKQKDLAFDVASNPEFLREGCAIEDFMHPDRVIVGTQSSRALNLLRELYAPLIDQGYRFLPMNIRSAELTKYASNAFLATKISFMNEMAALAEAYSADVLDIQTGLGLDQRISDRFLNAGCGFGGSCFPKDVSALHHMAELAQVEAPVLKATLTTNARQQRLLFDKLEQHFEGHLQGKTIALWGLAFKPNTDDIRCSTANVLMELLWQAGAKVQAYDPLAMPNVEAQYADQSDLTLCDGAVQTLQQADALLLVTEWPEFHEVDLALLKSLAVFDGRNFFDREKMIAQGMTYYAIGRGATE